MVEAYYHDNEEGDYTLPHKGDPLSLQELEKIGVFYKYINNQTELNTIASNRNYKNRDQVEIVESSFPSKEAFHSKLNIFYAEHYHDDEEIRYVTSGHGYFDVRSPQDSWIRISLSAGDLIILPPGIYHRFTLTSSMYVQATRLFKDQPKWEAWNRDLGRVSEARKEYVDFIAAKQ